MDRNFQSPSTTERCQPTPSMSVRGLADRLSNRGICGDRLGAPRGTPPGSGLGAPGRGSREGRPEAIFAKIPRGSSRRGSRGVQEGPGPPGRLGRPRMTGGGFATACRVAPPRPLPGGGSRGVREGVWEGVQRPVWGVSLGVDLTPQTVSKDPPKPGPCNK